MFTSFDLKYPEYEVITPQTHKSFCVRTLNVQEEEQLKGSLVSPIKITEHLNKCIFNAIVQQPNDIINYDTFLKTITLKDRDALLYALFHVTYEEIRNYDVYCSACERKFPVSINISDTFNYLPYPGEDVLTKQIDVKLQKAKDVTVTIKQPTLIDEMTAFKSAGINTSTNIDILTELLIIVKIAYLNKEGALIELSDQGDILSAYMSLPAKDKRLINNKYMETFGKYSISLKMQTNCAHCGNSDVHDIDLVDNFFRNIYSA